MSFNTQPKNVTDVIILWFSFGYEVVTEAREESTRECALLNRTECSDEQSFNHRRQKQGGKQPQAGRRNDSETEDLCTMR